MQLLQTEGNLLQGGNEKTLKKNNDQDENHRTQIKASHNGYKPTDLHQQRVGHLAEKTDNRIIRIGIDPGDDGSGDNHPDISAEGKINQFGDCHEEVTEHKHKDTCKLKDKS
jgi:hypothetical protein